jgi:hypothetical protein
MGRQPSFVAFFALALGQACTAGDGSKTSGLSGSPGPEGSSTSDTLDPLTTSSTTAVATTTTTAADDDGSSGGQGFLPADTPEPVATCDIWAQDCPEGQKCTAWAADGGSSWNGTRCVEIGGSDQPGDPCTTDGSDVSGNDTCDKGSMCFSVDPETDSGVCVELCQGSPTAPTCSTANSVCTISNDGALNLCLSRCDPILQDCPQIGQAQGCYPVGGDYLCWPDFSFDSGRYGDPCMYFNVCDPGLFCAVPELVPNCTTSGCCSEYCDLTDPAAGDGCSGSADGQECVPLFAEGTEPVGYEHVGACGLPT